MSVFSVLPLKGITKRWVLNVLCVVLGIIVVLEIIASFTIRSYFYDKIRQTVYYSANYATTSFARNSIKDEPEFINSAKQFAENFKEKGKMEVVIISKNGSPIASSTGMIDSHYEITEDYHKAIRSNNGFGVWEGKNSNGEDVMSISATYKNAKGDMLGVIRFIVSLEQVNKQIFFLNLFCIATGLAIFSFVVFAGNYFISSIVRPVREIGKTARQIALGDFSVRIAKPDDDEIGELCDTINYMASELGASERIKNDFISSVSHELRTPLTAIKGWAETLKEGDTGKEVTQKGMDIIVRETERLTGLVEDLLDFSHIQRGELAMNFTRLDVFAELAEAVYIYEKQAEKQGVSLIYAEPVEAYPVLGDANRIRQVFVNILDNAIKYTRTGGKVVVKSVNTRDEINIIISDTGQGIPEEEIDRVKEKFYKVDHNIKGSGIGLAVAEEIIKRHNGTLKIESREGVGTTVTIAIPVFQIQAEIY